jgi:hypoxanthine phosphoribosyltransferase
MDKPQPQINVAVKEIELLESEWKEARSSIARFDGISVDLRKYGFSLITFMITASSVVLGTATLLNPLPVLIVPFSIMIAICGLFLADRYNEVLLLACVVRARQIEDMSQEILETNSEQTTYSRLNLTTYLEDSVQRSNTRLFSLSLYFLFVFACFGLGVIPLISYYKGKGESVFNLYSYALVIFMLLALLFLLLANKSVSKLMRTIGSSKLIDERILVKIEFREKEVAEAIRALAKKINGDYKQQIFKVLTVGIGGYQFAGRLLAEWKKLGRANVEILHAYSQRNADGDVEIELDDLSDLREKNILIVDDIAASGRTIKKLRETCVENKASDVKICVLLNAPKRREVVDIAIDFAGLKTRTSKFLVGCGMDYKSECRDLPYIGVIKSYKEEQP